MYSQDHTRPIRARLLRSTTALAAVLIVLAFHAVVWDRPESPLSTFYSLTALVLTGMIILASWGRSFMHLPPAPGKVVVIVPAYNEDQTLLFECIESLVYQTRVPDKIIVVDDGSKTPLIPYVHPLVDWRRQENMGKRHAQINGLRGYEDVDFIVTVDSDSVLDKHAIENSLRAMTDSRVMAATGTCLVHNREHNLLTRMVDLEIVTGNYILRGARSVMGVVAPTSGPFSIYRSEIFFDNSEDYLSSGTYSDDRRLTHYSLLKGQVVVVDESVVGMVMPKNVRGMFRQRTRWFQGYFKYLPWELKNIRGFALIFRLWATLLVATWPFLLAYALVLLPFMHGEVYWQAWLYWMLILYAMSGHYLIRRPFIGNLDRLVAWALTPLLIPLQLFVIRPAMYYSLTQLRDGGWRTR